MLAVSVGEITSIIGIAVTILTALIIPWYKGIYNQLKKQAENSRKLEKVLKRTEKIETNINEIKKEQQKVNDFYEEYDEFFIQNLKYMINDSYVDYHSLAEIPDEKLANACECCEIYVNKKHLNHEIRPRCEQLWKERERRSVIITNQEESDGK